MGAYQGRLGTLLLQIVHGWEVKEIDPHKQVATRMPIRVVYV